MVAIIETRGGGDEFFHRYEEVEGLIESVQREIKDTELGKIATTGAWPREIIPGPSLRSIVQIEPLRVQAVKPTTN